MPRDVMGLSQRSVASNARPPDLSSAKTTSIWIGRMMYSTLPKRPLRIIFCMALRQASLPGLWIGCPPPWSHVSGPELQ